MDRETILQQFSAIESKISLLVNKCQDLEAANSELQRLNESLKSQLDEKIAAEKLNDDIKSLVISKIDGLMGKLNEFTEE